MRSPSRPRVSWSLLLTLASGCVVAPPEAKPADPAPFEDGTVAPPGPDETATSDTATSDTATSDTATSDTAATATLPSDYVYEEEAAPVALLDRAEVATAIGAALETLLRDDDPFLVLAAYDAAIAWEDGYCPYYYADYSELYGYDYWYGGCDTDGGSAFDGYVYGVHYAPYESYGYYYADYGWFSGDMSIDRADGQSFALSGYFYGYVWEYLSTGQTYFSVSASGQAVWTGPAFAETWLAKDMSYSLAMSGGSSPGVGSYIDIEGGVSGMEGVANSVWFEDVFMATEAQGSACPSEPSGTISIRDEAGEWYDVTFQGPAYAGASSFPPECDGCGDVWYRGKNAGMACLDFSLLTAWTGSPW